MLLFFISKGTMIIALCLILSYMMSWEQSRKALTFIVDASWGSSHIESSLDSLQKGGGTPSGQRSVTVDRKAYNAGKAAVIWLEVTSIEDYPKTCKTQILLEIHFGQNKPVPYSNLIMWTIALSGINSKYLNKCIITNHRTTICIKYQIFAVWYIRYTHTLVLTHLNLS